MTWHIIYEVREETSFMEDETMCIVFPKELCLACSLENNKGNYALNELFDP